MVYYRFAADEDEDGLFDYDGDFMSDDSSPIDLGSQVTFISTNSELEQIDKLGLYVSGGCSVGTFDSTADSLAEKFVKTVAIGFVGGSEVVWGEDGWYPREHGGWYSEGVQFRFFEQLMQYKRPGQALALAKTKDIAVSIGFHIDTAMDHIGKIGAVVEAFARESRVKFVTCSEIRG